jgi:hypothetical protein
MKRTESYRMYLTGGQNMNKRLAIFIIFLLSMAFSGNVYALDLSGTGSMDIHGFITQGYMVSSDNNYMADTEDDGTFQFNEMGINFSGDVSDRLRMGIQFIARDLGKMGNHEVSIDWASADYSFIDWFNLRAGKVKMAHGLYNKGRDIDMLRTFVFLPQSIYTETWRDSINTITGVGSYGYVPASFLGEFTYDLLIGTNDMKTDGGEARLLEQQVPSGLLLDVQEMNTVLTWSAAVTLDTFMSLDGLKFAASYVSHEFDAATLQWDGLVGGAAGYDPANPTTPNPAYGTGALFSMEESEFHIEMSLTTVGLEYTFGNTVFAAEYEDTSYDLSLPAFTKNVALNTYYTDGTGLLAKKFHALGYYGSVTHRFTDWFELGGYYSEYYNDKDDKDGEDAVASGLTTQAFTRFQKDSCIAFRFDITPNWILKLESHYIEGASRMFTDDGNVDANGNTTYAKYWTLQTAKISYSF